MKVRIEKEVKLDGKCFFYLYADDKYITNEPFRLYEPENSIYNEAKCYDTIFSLAKKIESGEPVEIKKIVYETKIDTQ